MLVLNARLGPLLARVGAPYAPAVVEWAEVDAALSRAPATALAVVDPYAGTRRGDGFPRLRDLLRRFPSVPVLAAMDLGPGAAGDVAMLLDWGVSEVIALETESAPGAVAARLRQAHARPFKRALEAALSPFVGAEARSLLRAAAEV
ncbi:MAG TPA: hypothetical protein VFQ45_14035, partial [Longimicrobium sp.]|nr:hypothetical protein [Longimicrobium sp.]